MHVAVVAVTTLCSSALSCPWVVQNQGVVCIRSSMSMSCMSMWRSTWMIPTLPSMWGAMAAHVRISEAVVAAHSTGKAPEV